MIDLELVCIDDLRVGDVVHQAGMRLRITAAPQVFRHCGRTTVHHPAVIGNFAEMQARANIDPYVAGLIVSTCRDGRFPVQGTSGSHWLREPRT